MSSTFRKTAINFHYEFTVRQLLGTSAPPDGHCCVPGPFYGLPACLNPCCPRCPQVRHLANVFQGLLMSTPEQFNNPVKWGKLWLHESERVYADRLVTVTDLEMYSKVRFWWLAVL